MSLIHMGRENMTPRHANAILGASSADFLVLIKIFRYKLSPHFNWIKSGMSIKARDSHHTDNLNI